MKNKKAKNKIQQKGKKKSEKVKKDSFSSVMEKINEKDREMKKKIDKISNSVKGL